MTFAHLCGCSHVLEQPCGSCMPKAEPLKSVLAGVATTKHIICHGAYSGKSPKPLQRWSLQDLRARAKQRPWGLVSDLVHKDTKCMADGSLKDTYSGIKHKIQDSQTYGCVLAKQLLHWCGNGSLSPNLWLNLVIHSRRVVAVPALSQNGVGPSPSINHSDSDTLPPILLTRSSQYV